MNQNSISLDQLDLRILNILLVEAKTSYADIGKLLDVSSGTIFVRVKKMTDVGVIRGSHVTLNHNMLGYNCTAYLGITASINSNINQVANALIEIDSIVESNMVSGQYNIICKLTCQDHLELGRIINDSIRTLDGVDQVESFIAFSEGYHKKIKL